MLALKPYKNKLNSLSNGVGVLRENNKTIPPRFKGKRLEMGD